MSKDLDKAIKPTWRDIPGYNGAYKINTLGEVVSFRWRGTHRSKKPKPMTPYFKFQKKSARFLKLTDDNGNTVERSVISLMAKTFFNLPDGYTLYHKNGDLGNTSLFNLQPIDRKELGRITGAQAGRKPVKKIDADGNIVDFYSSVRAAARANYMSYQSVSDRCNNKVKNPFAADGYNYQFDI